MNKFIFLLVTISLILFNHFSFAYEEEEGVIVLTGDNFDEVISQHPLILVEFYAPWCGHCKHLAPEYAQAATLLKGTLPIAKIDADAENNREIGSRFGIRGFPTIKLFRNGNPTDYEGERTSAAIVSFMKKQSLPAVSDLDSIESVKTFIGEERVVIVGFFDNKESEEYKTFAQTATEMRDSFIFGAVVGNNDIAKEFGAGSTPSVILFKQFDEGKNILASADYSNLSSFILSNSVPLIDEVGPHNYKFYAESGLPLGYIFIDLNAAGAKDQYVELIRPIAQSTKGKVLWVYIDWSKYAKHAERLGLSGKVVPAVAIEDLAKGTHYAFDETATVEATAVQSWVNKFLNGEVEPTIRSEDIPESNDGPVKVIVAKNYNDIVNDNSKDVLVEFYAPWCGHCKQLAPIYEEVGQAFAGIPSVVVGKIDATANDVNPNLGIRGFPTLKLFPANGKESPIDYNGDRSKNDLINFIKQHAGVKFELNTKDEL